MFEAEAGDSALFSSSNDQYDVDHVVYDSSFTSVVSASSGTEPEPDF